MTSGAISICTLEVCGFKVYIPIKVECYIQDYSAWIMAKSDVEAIVAQRFHFALREQSSSDILYECLGMDAVKSLSLSHKGDFIEPIIFSKN